MARRFDLLESNVRPAAPGVDDLLPGTTIIPGYNIADTTPSPSNQILDTMERMQQLQRERLSVPPDRRSELPVQLASIKPASLDRAINLDYPRDIYGNLKSNEKSMERSTTSDADVNRQLQGGGQRIADVPAGWKRIDTAPGIPKGWTPLPPDSSAAGTPAARGSVMAPPASESPPGAGGSFLDKLGRFARNVYNNPPPSVAAMSQLPRRAFEEANKAAAGEDFDPAVTMSAAALGPMASQARPFQPKAASVPLTQEGGPKRLTYQPETTSAFESMSFSPEQAAAARRAETYNQAVSRAPSSASGPPVEVPPGPGQINPPSPAEMAARESAVRPHVNSILGTMRRNPAAVNTLEGVLPSEVLTRALDNPAQAASIANWLRVYERVDLGKFSPTAKAALGLATRNLNNNLGTSLTVESILARRLESLAGEK